MDHPSLASYLGPSNLLRIMLQYFWKAKKYAYHLYQENMNRTRLKILYQNEGFSLVCWIELLRTEFCRENFIQARAGAPCWDALTLALGSVGNCTDLEQFPLKGEKRMTDYREWPKSGPLPTTSLSQWKYYVSSCFQIYFSGPGTRSTEYGAPSVRIVEATAGSALQRGNSLQWSPAQFLISPQWKC